MQLQDQRVLVTGATAGIGQEAAKLFARRGASVVITGRDTERGAQTVAAIEAEGGRAEFIAADLNHIKSAQRLAEHAGEVDVLINNAAATRTRFAPTLEQDVESFNTVFDVNVRAPFFLIQESVRIMRREKIAGSIVNIQSMSAHGGQPFIAAYCASKGDADPQRRPFAAQIPHPRQRPQYRLDVDAGRGQHPEGLSRREGRLA